MPSVKDGPSSNLFAPLSLKGNVALSRLTDIGISDEMSAALEHTPSGDCVGWGIPFDIRDVVAIKDKVVSVDLSPIVTQWLVFMHTSDLRQVEPGPDGLLSPMRGEGQLGEHAADYVMLYKDGTEERASIRRRHQLGAFRADGARTASSQLRITNPTPCGRHTSS
jgi:hypothetical protein